MMLTLSYGFLVNYSWIWISIVFGFTVFFLFPYGGAAMMLMLGRNDSDRMMIINTVVSKWWLLFISLALYMTSAMTAFPLFDDFISQGAFLVRDTAIAFMIVGAICCEVLTKRRNLGHLAKSTFLHLLEVSGWMVNIFASMVVVSIFTGFDYHIAETGPVWDCPKSGITMFHDPRTWIFCATWTAVSQTSALLCLYLTVWDEDFRRRIVNRLRIALPIVMVLFIIMSVGLLISPGYDIIDGVATYNPTKYLDDMMHMPVIAVMMILGFLLFFMGIVFVMVNSLRHAVFFYAPGVILVIVSLFMLAGLCHGSYFPSTSDPASSLTIHNSCAGQPTLQTFFFVTVAFIVSVVILLTFCTIRYHRKSRKSRLGC